VPKIKIKGNLKIHGKCSFFKNTNIIPIISVTTNNQIINLEDIQNYIVIDNSIVSSFTLTFGGIDGITFTDVFDINDYSNCKLTIATTPNISANKNEVFVTSSLTLSTIKDKFYTFYYFNTGSIIAGVAPTDAPLPTPPPTVVNVLNNTNNTGMIAMNSSLISPFVSGNYLISNNDSFILWSAINNYFFEL
jgi:hypothetical protein